MTGRSLTMTDIIYEPIRGGSARPRRRRASFRDCDTYLLSYYLRVKYRHSFIHHTTHSNSKSSTRLSLARRAAARATRAGRRGARRRRSARRASPRASTRSRHRVTRRSVAADELRVPFVASRHLLSDHEIAVFLIRLIERGNSARRNASSSRRASARSASAASGARAARLRRRRASFDVGREAVQIPTASRISASRVDAAFHLRVGKAARSVRVRLGRSGSVQVQQHRERRATRLRLRGGFRGVATSLANGGGVARRGDGDQRADPAYRGVAALRTAPRAKYVSRRRREERARFSFWLTTRVCADKSSFEASLRTAPIAAASASVATRHPSASIASPAPESSRCIARRRTTPAWARARRERATDPLKPRVSPWLSAT